MKFDLESIGLTQEEIQSRVVSSIVDQILCSRYSDEDGCETKRQSEFAAELKKQAKEAIDAKVREIGDRFVVPEISTLVENICLQNTNQWGEAKGEPISFIEYLVKKAEEYIKEPVNHNGKSRSEDSYSWTAKTTRIVHLVESNLKYSIQTAMEKALKDANSNITGGIQAAVKMALSEAQAKLKITASI